MKLLVASGGTGGHIFPALSVVLEWKERFASDEFLWIGTSRNRERELCERYGIPIEILDVAGLKRRLGVDTIRSLAAFWVAVSRMRRLLREKKPDAILAFGGYVSAPVLAAARLNGVPYYLQEQNTVPGMVNRIFAGGARCSFLGYPLAKGWRLRGATQLVGTPVRKVAKAYGNESYPDGFDRSRMTVLICGGSQGSLSMNRLLTATVKKWLSEGVQVVWQTGDAGYEEITREMGNAMGLFVFASIADLYPYYAAVRVVVGRSGASTINEAAYFGLPVVLIPLPWSAENHQWLNAGLVEARGWGVRVRQADGCGEQVYGVVQEMLDDDGKYEAMSRKALDSAPVNAASLIVNAIRQAAGAGV